jgi:hypothetical protein
LELKDHAKGLITEDSFIVLNKCIESDLNEWTPTGNQLNQLKESLYRREKNLKDSLTKKFQKVLEFPEVFSLSPFDHIKGLTLNWKSLS